MMLRQLLLELEHSSFDVVVAHEHFTNEELHTKLRSTSTGPSRRPHRHPAWNNFRPQRLIQNTSPAISTNARAQVDAALNEDRS
jgi:hypothetical protein